MRTEIGDLRAAAVADLPYPVPAVFDVTRLLPPPPTDEAAQRDLEAVRVAQQSRTPEQIAEAEANSALDVFLFAAALGPRFTPERTIKTSGFLRLAYRSSLPHLQTAKKWWNRQRPFVVDPTLAPLQGSLASIPLRSAPAPAPRASPPPQVDSPCTAPVAGTSYEPSYPSSHAFVGAMLAILLAEMVPERRTELFAFGRKYGDARVIGGVHFPSDVEAGRMLGPSIVDMLRENPRFRADLQAARVELRQVLGYS